MEGLRGPTLGDGREPGAPSRLAMDWETFYRRYREPGYVPGYEILNRLGSGVFGIVFKARKPSIGKFYAIKFLKVDDPSLKEAVARELETVKVFAQIDHPNLVSIEDCGEVDGIPYIVMGYAGEETLRTRLDKGALAEGEAVRVFVQVCRGVHALHERGLAHFDLKPANVFLKGSLARVGDYGLSKLISESRRTLSFGRGTPYYMAPEMLHRHGDHRSDLYSLGVLFYEMLAGEVPFKGDTEWEVLKRHETEPVRFPASFPAKLRPVVERLMEKDPERRYEELPVALTDLGETPDAGDPIRGGESGDVSGLRRRETVRAEAGKREAGKWPPLVDRVRQFEREVRDLEGRFRRELGGESLGSGNPSDGAGSAAAAAAGSARAGAKAAVFAAAVGARRAARGFGRALEFLVALPFRALGVALKVGLFCLGVWVAVLLVKIFVSLFLQLFRGLLH